MDVIQSNFKENLPAVEEAIKNCSFLSVDGEFSGLNQSWNIRAYDTPEERFDKVRQNAEDFLLIQFGLCTFHYNTEKDKYTHQAFNFYIFPRLFKKITSDKRFYCQASSLEFLVSQGFDFNKLYKEGIPYVRASEITSLREELHQRQTQRLEEQEALENGSATPKTPSAVPDEHKNFLDSIHSQVEEFISSEMSTVQLSPCSAYRRKLIYETVKPKFPDLSLETVQSDKGTPLIKVTKADKEEMKKINNARLQAENDQLEEAIGFTKVIQMITESGKLVVGHNMLLDLLHIIHQFCCELPQRYDELKEVTKTVLPRVLDTKLMASTNPLKDHFQNTGLSNIFKQLNEKPFSCPIVEPSENCPGYSPETELLHEAGYDAYITGLVFISLVKHLNSLRKKNKKVSNKDVGSSPVIQPFVNKVFMMMSPDIPYLNLGGNDLQPNRDHVFHVTFPSEWKMPDLIKLFSPHGPISVSWIDDSSAFVALAHSNRTSSAAKRLVNKNKDDYRVTTFEEFNRRKLNFTSSPSVVQEGTTSLAKRKSQEDSLQSSSEHENSKQDAMEEQNSDKDSPNPKKHKSESKLFDEPSSWD